MLYPENKIGVELCGVEVILLDAVTGSLATWPFEKDDARDMAQQVDKKNSGSISDSVRKQWLLRAGLPNKTRDWTPELIRTAGNVRYTLLLTKAEWGMVHVAIRACKEEFQTSWGEFLCVFGGALYEFDLGIDALDALLERIHQ